MAPFFLEPAVHLENGAASYHLAHELGSGLITNSGGGRTDGCEEVGGS